MKSRESARENQGDSIRRGQVYSTAEVIDGLGIASKTLDKWRSEGLRFSGKAKTYLYLGDHLIAFLFGE